MASDFTSLAAAAEEEKKKLKEEKRTKLNVKMPPKDGTYNRMHQHKLKQKEL